MFNDPLAQLARRWVYRIRRPDAGRKSNLVRLAVNGLEDRLAPAQLPAATVFESRTAPADKTITSLYQYGVSAAQSVLDPRVFAIASTNGAGVTLQVSTNAGQSFGTTFTTFNNPAPATDIDGTPINPLDPRPISRRADPTTTTTRNDPAAVPAVAYTNSDSPAVAIGRDGTIYMVHTQHNADRSTGAVIAQKFSAGGTLQATSVVYQWAGADPAYNPTITVDSNLPTILDPEGKASPRTDPNPNGLVVIAFGTNAQAANQRDPQYLAAQSFTWNPNQIFLAVSGDSGATFSSPTRVNAVGFFAGLNPVSGAADPVVAFGPDGRLTTFWASIIDTKTNPNPPDNSMDPLDSSAFVDTFRLDPTATSVRIVGAGATLPDATVVPNVPPHAPGMKALTIPIANADTDARFTTFRDLTDLDVEVALTHQHLNQVTITLTPPAALGLAPITLLNARTDTAGTDSPVPGGAFGFQRGLPDSKPNLGINDFLGTGQTSFTVFDDQGARAINDPGNPLRFIGHYRPEAGSLATIANAITTRSQLTGDWVLTVMDNRNNDATPPEVQRIESWALRFTSQFDNNTLGTDTQVQTLIPTIFPLQSGLIETHPLIGPDQAPASPTVGIGPGISVAYDKSFSPDVDVSHPGRLYVAYTERIGLSGSDTDVMLTFSDDGGLSWNAPTRVNDDSIFDNTTEGNRAQFQPSVAVDPVTGTVGVTWYDTRNDADLTRASRFFASSIDGGLTFSPQVAINAPKIAVDAITNTATTLEVRPDNFVQAGAGGAGVGQSLLASNGKFYPFWTGNQNAINGTTQSQILTATIRTASGPRIISSDLGAVTDAATAGTGDAVVTYNDTVAADGTRRLDGFTITFDRAIDPTTFGPTDITVIYRNPNQLITDPGTPVAVASVTAIDENPSAVIFAFANRQFFVRFTTPQTGVGTYSYSVGPDIRDRVRNPYGVSLVPAADQFTNPFTTVAAEPIPDGIETFPGSGILQKLNSEIIVPALPAGQVVGDLVVTVNIDSQFTGDLKLQLFSPTDTTFANPVTLSNALGGAGDNYTFTRFDESASRSIAAGTNPFTGTFRPTGLLSNFIGQAAGGMWTLRITDSTPFNKFNQTNHAATLLNWSITIVPGQTNSGPSPSLGSYLDQDADARSGTLATTFPRSNDIWAVPDPVGAIPFALPYLQDSLPLSIPGPYVRPDSATEDNISIAGQAPSLDNLVLNGTASSVTVRFDRDMDASSFTADDIIRINGPVGVVYEKGTTALTAIAVAAVVGDPRSFTVSFPTQKLSGDYSIILGADIKSAAGFGLDSDRNAGRFRLLGDDPTSEALTVNTYNATTPVTVKHRGTSSISLTVTDDYIIRANTLSHIQVKASFSAPVITDLAATLVAPDGTRVQLFRSIGASGPAPTGLINLVFDDAAAPPIQTAVFPFNNNPYTPQLPLSALLGKGAKGVWRLEVNNLGASLTVTDAVINSFSLLLPQSTPNTGLSVAEADNITIPFRIFTQDPTDDVTRDNWTQVGPTSLNNGDNVGSATAIAVDPSDPSGNTVYVGGAGGGVWKTNNFLTDAAGGPSWVPLTDFGPANGLNIGSIALFPRNNDPNQTVVFALTGDPSRTNDVQSDPLGGGQGIGVLRSMNGGRTWAVLDSQNNAGSLGNGARNNIFYGSRGHKIVVDPTPASDGEIIVYMALSGNTLQNGLWRSNTSGRTWSRLTVSGLPGLAPDATDVLLAAGSAGSNGNLQTLYVAYPQFGVYTTSAAASATTVTPLTIGQGNPLIRDITSAASLPAGTEVAVTNNGNPSGFSGRLILAAPALTDSPLLNSFYAGWLYAAVSDGIPGQETFSGLFMTKDFGRNWTPVHIPALESAPGDIRKGYSFATNDETNPDADPTGLNRRANPQSGRAAYALSLAVDPSDPDIVYLAGLGTTGGSGQNTGGSYRIDTTKIRDPQSFVFFNNSDNVGGGAPLQINTVGGAVATGTDPQQRGVGKNRGLLINPDPSTPPYTTDFINLSRDPFNPFIQNSTLQVYNFVTNFTNDGKDVSYMPFTDILSNGQGGANDVHAITTYLDPLTRRTRLVYGTGHGVFTGVDDGKGNVSAGLGFSDSVSFSRNGNLQLSEFYAGAVQTSQFAADIAGSLFYGMSKDNGFPVASKDIFRTGDLNWTGPLTPGPELDPILGLITYNFSPSGTGVAVDPQGSGAAYQYRQPFSGGDLGLPTDFFRYLAPGTNHATSGASRTFGLLQAGDNPGQGQGQWPLEDYLTGYFATNPFNSKTLAISSAGGRVFRTTDQGVNWFPVAEPNEVNASGASRAIAFGAPEPREPGKVDDFIIVGNSFSQVFVTNTGDGNWVNTGVLDGTAVQQIVADPTPGSRRAFAVTEQGVYFNEDVGRTPTANAGGVAPSAWLDITGNLFQLRKQIFGDANKTGTDAIQFALRYLTSIQADWRFSLPVDPLDPTNTETTPILYVGGEGGVFRSKDRGNNWEFFPQIADGAAVQGGYLPSVKVTDLDLSIGAIDPATGKYKSAADNLNMLVATTYGRGTYAIRLDETVDGASVGQSGPRVVNLANPNPPGGPSSSLKITFSGAVDIASFKTGDVTLLDPSGKAVTVTAVKAIPPTPGTPDPRNFYEIDFAQQTVAGLYKLTVGPEVSDLGGFKMNQNQNAVNGELDDAYIQYVYLNGLANSLTLDNLPVFVTAGVPATFTVTARDANGNALTGLNQTVNITISDANPLVSIPTTVNLVNGVATVTGALITAGQQSLGFTSAGLNPTKGDILVKAAAASKFDVTGYPTTGVVAGVSKPFTVTARDPFNNVADAYAGTVRFFSTDTKISSGNGLPADATLTKGVGTFAATFKTANTAALPTHALAATDTKTPSITGVETGIVIIPAAAASLTITGYPATVVAGEANKATITALDVFGNVATGYAGTIGFTSSDGKVSVGNGLPANNTLTSGVGNFDVTLKTAGAQTVTVTDTTNGTLKATASTTVKAAVAASFLVDLAVSKTTAGDPVIVSVDAKDQFDNLAVGYTGTVRFSSSDPQVSISNGLPPDAQLISGSGKFTVVLKTAGSQSVTATDTVTTSVTGSDSAVVIAAAASKLTLSTLASPVNAGQSTPFSVVAQDIYGNLATTFSDTLSFSSNDPQATLPPDTKGTATSNFDVTFRTSGSRNITVTAAGTGITPVTGSTTVLPGAATAFVLTNLPGTVTAGNAAPFNVAAKDQFGNLATGYTGIIRFTSSDLQAGLPADSQLVSGNGTFAATLKTAGTQSVTATDTTDFSLTATGATTVRPTVTSKFTVVGLPPTTTAGKSATFNVVATDRFGNVTPGFLGAVALSTSDPQGTITPATYTFVAADGGTKQFTTTLKTAGTQSVTAGPTAGSITFGSASTVVSAATVSKFGITGLPDPVSGGVPTTFTVVAQDAFGNPITGFTGKVAFTSSDPNAVLPASYPFQASDGGSKTFSLTFNTGGPFTLTATSGAVVGTVSGTATNPPLPPNTPPTISATAGTPARPATVAVTVGDTETLAANLVVTADTKNSLYTATVSGTGASRTVTVSPVGNAFGTVPVTITVTDGGGLTATSTVSVTLPDPTLPPPPPPPPPPGTANPLLVGTKMFTVAADRGGSPDVKLYSATGTTLTTATVFPAGFTGGVRTASADFNGDGTDDIVVGTGPGVATLVRILDGVTKAELFRVNPFESSFTGGVYVAAGDLTGDGKPDLVITPDEGGGPRADVYSGDGFGKIISFFGIDDKDFRGGARAAVGDVDGDGIGDLVVAAGFGGGPRVAGYSGKSLLNGPPQRMFGDFFAFEQSLRNGVFIAVGDLNGDGKAEVIAGGGPGGGPRVTAFDAAILSGNILSPVANFFAGNSANRGGIRVAVKNLDGDTRADLVVGDGTGAGSGVTAYLGKDIGVSGTPPAALDFDAFDGFDGGVFVG